MVRNPRTFFFKILFIQKEREREHEQVVGGQRERERERKPQADFALNEEPNLGLDLMTLSS